MTEMMLTRIASRSWRLRQRAPIFLPGRLARKRGRPPSNFAGRSHVGPGPLETLTLVAGPKSREDPAGLYSSAPGSETSKVRRVLR